ncbi:leucine-rich repeat-containing protein 26 [Hyla sarda]|uniref:leucine-rich repeat-containing protein 26 n=1 Tax=Hyla sarda TaxID=327740 RepID=UPI0024C3FAD2|nr:leucine-rich repeat-containing protein 26 [Hyla sarda]
MKVFLEIILLVPLISPGNLQDSRCPDICSCSLGVVDCYGRGLHFIPENLDKDTHTVLLAYNKITALKTLSFHKYPNLYHLELHNNLISTIDPQAFKNLQNLSYLDLSSNQLTALTPEMFRPLFGLKTLNLSNNRIARLPENILKPLGNLTALYLHNNALIGLRVDILYSLPALTQLRLDGNPWVCTCQIQFLLSWMIDNAEKIYEKERTLCGVPKYLNQYPVMDIARDSFDHCQHFFTLYEYLYFLLIGMVLFMSSTILCLITGSLIVSYERLVLKVQRKPHVYKKRIIRKRENTTNGHHLPVCRI